MSSYIERNKENWGLEFASLFGIEHRTEYNEIAAMACVTMMYHIADNFRDGEFREEILKFIKEEK